MPQCITVPAMYETAETKQEKRAGISAQYGEGHYTGLCTSTKYNYKYGGMRVDYGNVKKYGNIIEAGSSIAGFYETSSDTNYENEGLIVQLDGRLTGKIVTPTSPVRLGLKLAPGLILFGGISQRNGEHDVGGEYGFLSYASLLVGAGNPEFLTVAYHYFPYYYYLKPSFNFLTITVHRRNYSITAGGFIPIYRNGDEIPKYHFTLGAGIHY
ncbi:MAG: hypothetical protein ACPL28_10155 [bacterium]